MTRYGTLYGIGVGPGDPDLLTLKAIKTLQKVDVVLAAASTKNEASLALSIARPHLGPQAETLRLNFPMTRDAGVLENAWRENADAVAKILDAGRSAAFLTLGDPLTYSTFGYLARALALRSEAPVAVIPGITSYQAAAAATGRVLVESGESLAVVSGVADEDSLTRVLESAQCAVILKAYKNLPAIRRVLEKLGLGDSSVFVTRLGLEGEEILTGLRNLPEKPSYYSLILVRRS
ncbi:MAG: precorrin-2 C(20)-methyltransferase [Desulfovibrionaceae bacterium CG1_02_65_16]|nr:MAG: precorrin-2 C(20)-methyltransferase [Desulfovibrionaceae bacterium CG1_02_65_16]